MSKLPDVVVKLSAPMRNRWYKNDVYCTGIVATKEVVDNCKPLVSSYVMLDLDENFNTVYCLTVKYTYMMHPSNVQETTWHQYGRAIHFSSLKEAVARAESLARMAYEDVLSQGIAKDLNERLQ